MDLVQIGIRLPKPKTPFIHPALEGYFQSITNNCHDNCHRAEERSTTLDKNTTEKRGVRVLQRGLKRQNTDTNSEYLRYNNDS